jgi:hypothetical protein
MVRIGIFPLQFNRNALLNRAVLGAIRGFRAPKKRRESALRHLPTWLGLS